MDSYTRLLRLSFIAGIIRSPIGSIHAQEANGQPEARYRALAVTAPGRGTAVAPGRSEALGCVSAEPDSARRLAQSTVPATVAAGPRPA